MSTTAPLGRLYGRRSGHALRQGQQALLDEALPRLALPADGPLDARALFGDTRPVALEIGFGSGEHLAAQAAARPDWGFIGCEPFVNGVVGLLGHVVGQGLTNVRILPGDAREVLARLPEASLAAAFLLHPDPWPKARHAKRRFVNDGPLDLLASRLAPGAEFRWSTDHPTYVAHALAVLARRHDLRWTARKAADFLERPDDWPETRYERKARRLGHEVWYFRYRRAG